MKQAVVAFIEGTVFDRAVSLDLSKPWRPDWDAGVVLCVWNKRYGGWSLPGGMVEERESLLQALGRELREETSLEIRTADALYDAPSGPLAEGYREPTEPRGSHVYVYRVTASGVPRESEIGCPCTWFTRDEFLRWSPFAPFYRAMFDRLDARTKANAERETAKLR